MFRFLWGSNGRVSVKKSCVEGLGIFKKHPDLLNDGQYRIKCQITQPVVDDFVARLRDGKEAGVRVTEENVDGLKALCRELGYKGFDRDFLDFRRAQSQRQARLYEDVLYVKASVSRMDLRLEALSRQVMELTLENQRLKNEFKALARRNSARDTDTEKIKANLEKKVDKEDLGKANEEIQKVKTTERRHKDELVKTLNVKADKSELSRIRHEVEKLKEAEASLAGEIRKAMQKAKQHCVTEFGYSPSRPLDGIIAALTRTSHGNVHDRGTVNITASSVYGGSWEPKNAADLETETPYYSSDEPNVWICYDFKGKRIIPTSYSIRSWSGRGPGSMHLKSWVIEVSNDGSQWTLADRRLNNNALNGQSLTENFAITEPVSGKYRYIRLRQIGDNHCHNYYVIISALEIFGTLDEEL